MRLVRPRHTLRRARASPRELRCQGPVNRRLRPVRDRRFNGPALRPHVFDHEHGGRLWCRIARCVSEPTLTKRAKPFSHALERRTAYCRRANLTKRFRYGRSAAKYALVVDHRYLAYRLRARLRKGLCAYAPQDRLTRAADRQRENVEGVRARIERTRHAAQEATHRAHTRGRLLRAPACIV